MFVIPGRVSYQRAVMTLGEILARNPELRGALRELTMIRPVWNLKLLVLAAIWVGCGAAILATDSLWIRVPAWFAIGAVIHSFAIFLHEACHGILFESRFWNRWVGWLCGLPALISMSAYKSVHLTHHAHTKQEADPDELMWPDMPELQGRVGILVWLLVGGPYYVLFHVPFFGLRLAASKLRREILVEYALIALIAGGITSGAITAGRVDLIIDLWAIPAGFALGLVNLRGAAEHILCKADDAFSDSRTVTSNRLVSFAMNNLNYHLEHHLVPRVPWYNLPQMHARMQPHYAALDVHVRKSYLAFLAEVLVKGPLDIETWHLSGEARARQDAYRARFHAEKKARRAAARAGRLAAKARAET